MIAGMPLSEYIRHRRMTAAAFDLQSSNEKIIDIALKYGYESPTSFNRAFQNVHGISPTAARNQGVSLNPYLVRETGCFSMTGVIQDMPWQKRRQP